MVLSASSFPLHLGDATLMGLVREGVSSELSPPSPPLVLLHGFGGSHHDWQPLIATLSASRDLILYDQRGFGASTAKTGHAFSHADDLLCVLDRLGIEQADICGLSMGGGNALHFALNYPQRVRGLILISPLMLGWSWSEAWITRWKAIGRAAREGHMDEARKLWWRHPLFESTRSSPAAPRLRASIDAYHGAQWVHDDQCPTLPDIDRLTRLHTPTLLLTGGLDMPDFRLIADAITALAKNVQRIDYAQAGHLLTLEHPAIIGGAIEAFLQNL